MTCDDDTDRILAKIEKTEAMIDAIEDALLAFSTSNIQSYRLSTGQTDQTVTRANIVSLRGSLDSLENRRAVLRAQLGCGQRYARPAW